MNLLSFVFIFTFATLTIAAPCNHSNVKTLSNLSTYISQPSTFEYKYQYFPPATANDPVVIFLTGGPGQTAIGNKMSSFPKEFGQILIDPRGIGCNLPSTATAYPGDFYTTDNYVKDLLEVVKDTGVTQNLIVYGISYGTIVATQLASELERNGIYPKVLY